MEQLTITEARELVEMMSESGFGNLSDITYLGQPLFARPSSQTGPLGSIRLDKVAQERAHFLAHPNPDVVQVATEAPVFFVWPGMPGWDEHLAFQVSQNTGRGMVALSSLLGARNKTKVLPMILYKEGSPGEKPAPVERLPEVGVYLFDRPITNMPDAIAQAVPVDAVEHAAIETLRRRVNAALRQGGNPDLDFSPGSA